jgi:hypothetical protein
MNEGGTGMTRRRRIICIGVAVASAAGLLISLGFAGYEWVQTTIGQPIPWVDLYEIGYGGNRDQVIALLGEPTRTSPTTLRWEGSNGWVQISFDQDGSVRGWSHDKDPQLGIKRVWTKTYLPYAWLSYFVELRRP